MSVKSLSVFFPAFNEEKNIAATIKKAVEVLKTLGIKWEVVVVDDGSFDKTREVAEEIARVYPGVSVVHQTNGGYGMALRSGFRHSRYEWVVYTDSDGQFDFSEISKFLAKTDQADVIWGYRIARKDPFYRKIFARGWALSVFLFFRVWLKDIDCGFKMVKHSVLDAIGELESKRGGMINAELAIKAKKHGFKLAQAGVNHYPRVAGKPTGASLQVVLQSYIDLFKLWLKLK